MSAGTKIRLLLIEGLALIPALLLGVPFAGGQAVIAAIAIAITAVVFMVPTERTHATLPWMTWVFWAAALATAIQAVPLPFDAVARMATASWSRAVQTLSAAGLESGWSTLSVDPSDTVREAIELAAFGLFLTAVTSVAAGKERFAHLLRSVACLGLVELVLGLANVIAGPTDLFAGFSAMSARPGFHITILNDNQAAGLFNLCTFCALALALDADVGRTRTAWLGCTVAFALASLAMFSRAGAVTLVLMLAAFAAFRRLAAPRSTGSRRLRVLYGVLLMLVFPASLVGIELLLAGWSGESILPGQWGSKVVLWREALDLVGDHPWTGTGHGAFASAFSAYSRALSDLTVGRVENAPLQAVADWGIPAGVLLVAGACAAFGMLAVTATGRASTLAALFGIASVAVHNLADFSLELPGVLLPTLLVLGAVIGRCEREHRRRAGLRVDRSVARLVALGALPLAAALPWAVDQGRTHAQDRLVEATRLAHEHRTDATASPAEWIDWREELRHHPHASHMVYLASHIARLQGDAVTGTALARQALRLAPSSHAAGLEVVRLDLAAGQADDALPRIDSLLNDHPDRLEETLLAFDRMGMSPRVLAHVLEGRPRLFPLVLNRLRLAGLTTTEAGLLAARLETTPEDYDSLARLAFLELQLGRLESADGHATRLIALFPNRDAGYLVAGRLAFSKNLHLEAAVLFAEAYRASTNPVEAGVRRLQCLALLGSWGEFDALASEMEHRVALVGFWETRFQVQVAMASFRRGRTGEALARLAFADKGQPSSAVCVARAKILEETGRTGDALREFERALSLEPDNAEARAGRERLSAAPLPR